MTVKLILCTNYYLLEEEENYNWSIHDSASGRCLFRCSAVSARSFSRALSLSEPTMEFRTKSYSLNTWQCTLHACAVEHVNIITCGLYCKENFGMGTMYTVWAALCRWRSYHNHITIRAHMYSLCGACSGSPQLTVVHRAPCFLG